MGWLADYFNLSPHEGILTIVPQPISLGWQLALYAALLLGILANGVLVAVRAGKRYRFQWSRFLVSAIIGVVIFPAVYDGARSNLDQPTLVQLALIFSAGMGYESIFSGIAGLAGARAKK
jgi:uncharacterized membrane protein